MYKQDICLALLAIDLTDNRIQMKEKKIHNFMIVQLRERLVFQFIPFSFALLYKFCQRDVRNISRYRYIE